MIELKHKDWNPVVRERLNKMMQRAVNSSDKQYAVVDWDNTFVYMDTSEVFLLEQLAQLKFNVTPQVMEFILKKGIPKTNYKENYKTDDGKAINADMIVGDIVNAFAVLYEEYIKGDKTLEEVKKLEEYKEFVAKYYYNYKAVIDSFGPDIAYVWAKYSMTNMTEEEIAEVTRAGIEKQGKTNVKKITLDSSEVLKSDTGPLSVSFTIGYRFIEPMQELAKAMQANGIDLYVDSAAYQDIIGPVVSNPAYGYDIPKQNAYAMRFEKKNNKSMPEYKEGYFVTFKGGKTDVIKTFIAPKYDGRAPIFVAGDSDGDVAMMTDFDVDTVLVINRNKGGLIGQMADIARQGDGNVVMQGRNENTGTFIPSMETITFGQNTTKVFGKSK